MQFEFGIGNLFAIRTDTTPVQPVPFGNIQDAQFDFSFEEKELYGQNQFPVAVARAKAKITGKAKFAHINGVMFNNLFFGGTNAVGQTLVQNNENHAVPATPFTVTITPPSGTIVDDLGVTYANSGIAFLRVASAPTVGQYSYAAGVYTFAAADTAASVNISYSYTVSPAAGSLMTYSNQLMGAAPQFSIVWGNTYQAKSWYLKLNACISTKFNMPMKLDDFAVPEFDFSAFADASGNILTLSSNE